MITQKKSIQSFHPGTIIFNCIVQQNEKLQKIRETQNKILCGWRESGEFIFSKI